VIDESMAETRRQWEIEASESLSLAVRAASLAWSGQLASFAASMSEALRKPGEERFLTDLRKQWREIRQ
jgi:hypothetical protein